MSEEKVKSSVTESDNTIQSKQNSTCEEMPMPIKSQSRVVMHHIHYIVRAVLIDQTFLPFSYVDEFSWCDKEESK